MIDLLKNDDYDLSNVKANMEKFIKETNSKKIVVTAGK